VTNHSFVLNIRATRLTLTASLKAAQVAGNLLIMQTTLRQTASRLAIQTALRRYSVDGNTSDSNWDRARDDFDAVFVGEGDARLAVQARLYPSNTSDFYIFNRTVDSMKGIVLPYKDPEGKDVHFGDAPNGYPPDLYPKYTAFQRNVTVAGNTENQWFATFNGREISSSSQLFSGPFRINSTLSLVSITMPIINNTSSIDTMGWLTVVLDAGLIARVVNALEGLDDSGLTMIIGSDNSTNKFPTGTLYSAQGDPNEEEAVSFVLPPTNRTGADRHKAFAMASNPPPFNWTLFSAVKRGFTEASNTSNNAGSIVSTRNEVGSNVAVGYAVIDNPMVDWLVLIEQSHAEVWAPITRLRNILLACVFGTIGAMLLLAFPVAHYSSRPIRRLRDATRSSVAPHLYEDDSFSSNQDGTNDGHDEALAKKEGFFGSIVHYRRNQKVTRKERREAERRRQFRIPAKVKDRKHFIHDELTDLTATFNEMTDELMMQYEKLEERVQQRTAELEQSKEAAEAANESKTLFIANISHELKTPLNGILGMCAVCMSEDDPIKLRRSLGIIYKSGDLLLNLLTDLLTFRYVPVF
jgi:osomolarity two-component system sensor histidine kinase SLN1